MKILNLYAGIGGNRKLWGDSHEITAVEYDADIAKVYADHFPNDTVIVADAHQYLLDHFAKFDFIFEECANKYNSKNDIIQDLFHFAVQKGDSLEDIMEKEHQIQDFIQNILMYTNKYDYLFYKQRNFLKLIKVYIDKKVEQI